MEQTGPDHFPDRTTYSWSILNTETSAVLELDLIQEPSSHEALHSEPVSKKSRELRNKTLFFVTMKMGCVFKEKVYILV